MVCHAIHKLPIIRVWFLLPDDFRFLGLSICEYDMVIPFTGEGKSKVIFCAVDRALKLEIIFFACPSTLMILDNRISVWVFEVSQGCRALDINVGLAHHQVMDTEIWRLPLK